MDQRNFPYSIKNIPVKSKRLYLKILIDKVELLINRMRWKALFFEYESENTFNYGSKTHKCPPTKMISNVQLRRVNNDFQNKLKNDIRSIQSIKK